MSSDLMGLHLSNHSDIIEKGPIKGTKYLHNGKGMEYLFHWLPEDSSSEPPLKHLEWSGLGVQTAQRAIIGVPASYRSYRCDTPPSIDRGTRQSEGDRGGRTELTHGLHQVRFRITRNLNLVVSFL